MKTIHNVIGWLFVICFTLLISISIFYSLVVKLAFVTALIKFILS
jgi:hypothetical protein